MDLRLKIMRNIFFDKIQRHLNTFFPEECKKITVKNITDILDQIISEHFSKGKRE